jgi:RNA polymerase sigma factor (sigma-70 family)
MRDAPDIDLIRNYAAYQSEWAFETIVSRYVNLVYSSAIRQVGDPHLAEEVTQAVFITLARKAGSFGPDTVLPSWLHRTACFIARDALKTRNRRLRREQEAYMQSSATESTADANETWLQIAPLLDKAVADLGEKDRHAIVLRFFENKSLGDVGRALGANEDAARMRVNRALEKLRKFFTKRGVASTTTVIAGLISANSVQAAPATLAATITVAGVTKGAAAAGSTLALVKGGLKLMAWTKVKTTTVAAVIVSLLIGTSWVMIQSFLNRDSSSGRLLPAPDSPTTVELSGTVGAAFTGEYLRGRERVVFSGVLPWSRTDTNMVRLEIHKLRTEDMLQCVATRKGSWPFYFSAFSNPGTKGLKFDFSGGGNVTVLR